MKTKGYSSARKKYDLVQQKDTSCHSYVIVYQRNDDNFYLDCVSHEGYMENKDYFTSDNIFPLLYFNSLWQKFPSFKKIKNKIITKKERGLL